MKLIHFIILPLMCIVLTCCTDHKEETATAVKLLEEYSLLEPEKSEDSSFYTAFRRYQNGDSEITDFPFLSFLSQKDNEKNPIPKRVWMAFIDAGADVNAEYVGSKDTPLCLASRRGDDELVEALLDAGADVNGEDAYGRTPLHEATATRSAAVGSAAVVKALIAAGANVNAKTAGGWTPLHAAGSEAVVKALLAAGADVNAKNKKLSAAGMFPVFPGDTPLHCAADGFREDCEAVVKALLAAGADTNAKNEEGETPLHRAAAREQEAVVKALIAAGADVNAKDSGGGTPLHAAGSEAVVKALIAAGADVNAKDSGGETPLHAAGSEAVVKALIAAGADVNAKDKDGWTPLHWSARVGNEAKVKALVAAGADVNAKNKDGQTPLYWTDYACESIRNLLKAAGAK